MIEKKNNMDMIVFSQICPMTKKTTLIRKMLCVLFFFAISLLDNISALFRFVIRVSRPACQNLCESMNFKKP